MQKIIVPDDEDGLVYMTSDGLPIMQIAYRDDSSILTLFSKNENSKIMLICHENESVLSVRNGQKNIELSIDSNHNGIAITNEDGNITNLIQTDENGGQITLSDYTGNPLLDMGIASDMDGSLLFIRNKNGESVVSLICHKDSGYIQVSDKNNDIIWSSPSENDVLNEILEPISERYNELAKNNNSNQTKTKSMSTLYHNNNTFVSTEVVEFDGQKYDPKDLIKVFVVRHDEYVGIFKGGAIAIVGIIALFFGGGALGTILLLFGGIWCARKFYDNQDERVPITVSVSFSGGRHTGNPDNFIVHIKGTSESKKLEEALWLAKEG